MFRTTFLTGYAIFGTLVRKVTAYIDTTTNAVEFRMIDGDTVPVTLDTQWKTLANGRNTIAAKIHSDGRFSSSGPSIFAYGTNYITGKNGQIMGRTEDTVSFIQHMLAVSKDSTFRGEGEVVRIADAQIIIQSLVNAQS